MLIHPAAGLVWKVRDSELMPLMVGFLWEAATGVCGIAYGLEIIASNCAAGQVSVLLPSTFVTRQGDVQF